MASRNSKLPDFSKALVPRTRVKVKLPPSKPDIVHSEATASAPMKTDATTNNSRPPDALKVVLELFKLGIQNHVDLPELVAIGEANSAKTILVEALVDIPASLRWRQDRNFSIKIATIPDHTQKTKQCQAYGGVYNNAPVVENSPKAALSKEQLHIAIDKFAVEAKDRWLASTTPPLYLEINGPCQRFSIIDTPNILPKTGNVGPADSANSRSLTNIQSRRVMILSCVDTEQSQGGTEARAIVDKADPLRSRTVGVLRFRNESDEHIFQALKQRAKEHSLSYGWWAMARNISDPGPRPGDTTHNLRVCRVHQDDSSESGTKSQVYSSDIGVGNLRLYLQQAFRKHVSKEMSAVQSQILTILKTSSETLRYHLDAQMLELYEQRVDYKGLARQQVLNTMNAETSKLSNVLRILATEFDGSFAKEGLRYSFVNQATPLPDLRQFATSPKKQPLSSGHAPADKFFNCYDFLTNRYHSWNGAKPPGQVAIGLLEEVFCVMAEKWETVALAFVSSVSAECKSALTFNLESVVKNDRKRSKLLGLLGQSLAGKFDEMKRKIKEHLFKESHFVQASDPDFVAGCVENRAMRMIVAARETVHRAHLIATWEKIIRENPPMAELTTDEDKVNAKSDAELDAPQSAVSVEIGELYLNDGTIEAMKEYTSEPRWSIIQLHDSLEAYYQVAVSGFLKFMDQLVIEPLLSASSSHNPYISLFDDAFVTNMSNQDLASLCSNESGEFEEKNPLQLLTQIEQLVKGIQCSSEIVKLEAEDYEVLRAGEEYLPWKKI